MPTGIFINLTGEDKISAFFRIYVSIIGLTNFIMTTFFSGKFISKLGIGVSLLILPISVFILSLGTVYINLFINTSIILVSLYNKIF